MKFQFFGRTPSLNQSIVSDCSSCRGESGPSIHSSVNRLSSIGTTSDEIETMSNFFEWESIESSQISKAVSIVSTLCSMVQSEHSGFAYDPSNKHTYMADESEHRRTSVDEKCRSKMLEWCFKVRSPLQWQCLLPFYDPNLDTNFDTCTK